MSDPDQVFLEENAVEGLALLQAQGHPLIVVSNQSGIGRGLYTAEDARRVNDRATLLLRRRGVEILAWYMCPHAPEEPCICRKPLPGMAIEAARDCRLELNGCYVIGDKQSDLELADAIGGTGILVTTGYGSDALQWAHDHARPAFEHLNAAAAYIGQRESAVHDLSPSSAT